MGRRRALLAIALVALAATTPSPARASNGDAIVRPWLTGIAFPTNLAWAPDGTLYVTDKDTGDVRVVRDGELLPTPLLHLDVVPGGETGLLGIALAPGFPREPWMYLYFSSAADQRNELVRVAVHGDRAGPVQHLLDLLPLAGIHNGGDLAFGTDGTLFVTVGEAGNGANAQDRSSLGGKVLRLLSDGSPADDPIPGPAYSMGLRNSFGICVDPSNGDVWETENGPASDDEVNRIVAGGNYGWPDQLGPGGAPRFVAPVVDHPRVIVPTGCAIWHGDLYYGAFDGAIRRLALPASAPARDQVVASVGAGITDLAVGPDGALYVATTDGIDRIATPPLGTAPPPPAIPPSSRGSGALVAAGVAVALAIVLGLVLTRRRRSLRSRPVA